MTPAISAYREMKNNEYKEALKKLTEVVKELNVELAKLKIELNELKTDYESHGHYDFFHGAK